MLKFRSVALIFFTLSFLSGTYGHSQGHWNVNHVGLPIFASFRDGKKTVVVGSNQGVIAALSLADGSIVRRRVFPEESLEEFISYKSEIFTISEGVSRLWRSNDFALMWDSGKPQKSSEEHLSPRLRRALKGSNDQPKSPFLNLPTAVRISDKIFILSDGIVRCLDSSDNGKEVWKWEDDKTDSIPKFSLVAGESVLYVIGFSEKTLVVWSLSLEEKAGSRVSQRVTHTLAVSPTRFDVIALGARFLAVVSDDAIHALNLDDPKRMKSVVVDLGLPPSSSANPRRLEPISDARGWFAVRVGGSAAFVQLSAKGEKLEVETVKAETVARAFISGSSKNERFVSASVTADDQLELSVSDISGKLESSVKVKFSRAQHGDVIRVFAGRQSGIDRFLVICQDHSVSLIQKGKLIWTREESMASILDVQFMDIPTDYTKKVEFDTDAEERIAFPSFTQRLKSHIFALKNLAVPDQSDDELVHDKFGFRKLMIVSTAPGKIFALDSVSGDAVWSTRYPGQTTHVATYITRKHALPNGSPAEIAVLLKDDKMKILLYLDALTGALLQKFEFTYEMISRMLSPHPDIHQRRILLLVDSKLKVHVYPSGEDSLAAIIPQLPTMYFHVTETRAGKVAGYALTFDEANDGLSATSLWTMTFPEYEHISDVATHIEGEHVQSASRSLDEKGYIHKYLNPNMIVISTVVNPEGVQQVTHHGNSAPSVGLYVVDGVTGTVLVSRVHAHARGPVSVVQFENSVIYQFWNDNVVQRKMFRNDINVMELFEEFDDSRNFTSLTASMPEVLEQSYTLHARAHALAVTRTRQGVTEKQLIVGLHSGQVMTVQKALLDPLRNLPGKPALSKRSLPYHEVIPFQHDMHVLSKDREISRISHIVTSHALVESTSLLAAWGLDLFHCRVMPSGMFDMLNADFSYPLLILTVVVVGVSSVVIDRIQKKRTLNAKWE
eukprot:266510_1